MNDTASVDDCILAIRTMEAADAVDVIQSHRLDDDTRTAMFRLAAATHPNRAYTVALWLAEREADALDESTVCRSCLHVGRVTHQHGHSLCQFCLRFLNAEQRLPMAPELDLHHAGKHVTRRVRDRTARAYGIAVA